MGEIRRKKRRRPSARERQLEGLLDLKRESLQIQSDQIQDLRQTVREMECDVKRGQALDSIVYALLHLLLTERSAAQLLVDVRRALREGGLAEGHIFWIKSQLIRAAGQRMDWDFTPASQAAVKADEERKVRAPFAD